MQDNMAHVSLVYYTSSARSPQVPADHLRLELEVFCGALAAMLCVYLPGGGRRLADLRF